MTNIILDLLFPKRCVGCKKFDSYFCVECVANIKQAELVCPKCEKSAVGGQTHPICRRHFGLDGLWSLGVYEDPLKKAIQKLKYDPKLVRDFVPVLVDIILEYWARYQPFVFDQIKKDGGRGWVVIPVPLHWWRENKRGFNQSGEIGKLLSKNLGLEYSEILKRTRYTWSQAKLKSKERQKNIRGAFAVSDSALLSSYTNILLIDDVWTTGATLKECCYVLKRSGAKKVWALTLAR